MNGIGRAAKLDCACVSDSVALDFDGGFKVRRGWAAQAARIPFGVDRFNHEPDADVGQLTC